MSVPALDTLHAQPASDRLTSLLDTPEDQWFDRKSARVKPADLASVLVAFANAEGGTVAIGMHDGAYDGDRLTVDAENAIRQATLDFTIPPVRADVERLDVGNGQSVLLVRVQPGEQVYETHRGDCFLRVGDESRKLTYTQRRELIYDRGGAQFEAEPAPGMTIDDVDPQQLAAFRTAIGSTADTSLALHARSLLTRSNELTIAGLLLFGRHPERALPQATVRVMRFAEKEAGTGSRHSLESGMDARFSGPIPAIIEEAVQCVSSWMPQRRALGASRRFEDIPLLPPDVWLEGLVNAVVHRSYSMAGDHIRVSIFPNRVEIESPGRFPGLADPTRPLDIARYARNPRIARVCSDLGITLERGEGIKRMFEEMRSVGLLDPQFEQTAGSVRLTLSAAERLAPEVQRQLPRGAESLLQILRHHGSPMGPGELIDASGRSRPWVRDAMQTLRDAGVVIWSGKSPRDPRATWQLND